MIAIWLGWELRRRWRATVTLTLLVTLATGTVLAAAAGAWRGATAVDRLLARTLPATVAVLPNQPGFDWDKVRALPSVAAVGTLPSTAFVTEGRTGEQQAVFFPPGDGEYMSTVERPVLLDGRMFAPDRPDEVVVTPDYVAHHGKGVGDTVELRLLSPEQVGRTDAARLRPEGPALTARIVGVIRSYLFYDPPGTVGTPGAVTRGVRTLPGLGMTPAQTRRVVLTQATVLAIAALAFGVPLGLAAGRTLWQAVAESTPVLHVTAFAGWAPLALVAPVTLLAAVALAAWPARTAARIRVADTLRAE